MYRAFQTSLHLLQPELVFVLGDIMDEGFYCSLQDFDKYVSRFKQLFAVPKNTKLYTVVGNHDIGFHNEIKSSRNQMFITAFNSTPVQFFTLRGNYFVLINSMALEGDGCTLCKSVEIQLSEIEKKLKCSKNSTFLNCTSKPSLEFYSKPILMQHYPLYRSSDMDCTDFDSAPMPIKEEIFKEARECLSKNSTYHILNQIKPRLALSGHTHHGCTRKLPFGFGEEITISSFNRRNKNNPTIGLGVITPNNLAFIKCPLPQESTIIIIYISGMTVVFCWTLYSSFIKRYISSLKYIYRGNFC
ncbi:hypothetical protein WA026_023123 [Henosepilachna vigintioctopunctata]|uniref:Calcineurin-like phosphoesterase domain-containing protein n=1 Tax=Henosepilachna vigintioctopunctata TaxID=420089 RepID=A0AAW1UEW7_9CUCU